MGLWGARQGAKAEEPRALRARAQADGHHIIALMPVSLPHEEGSAVRVKSEGSHHPPQWQGCFPGGPALPPVTAWDEASDGASCISE